MLGVKAAAINASVYDLETAVTINAFVNESETVVITASVNEIETAPINATVTN